MAKPKRAKFSGEQWIVLATLMIASFMGRLDGTIVNLALPKIISDFGITVSNAAWISTAYIIANAIFVPIFGKLGDLIGRKPLYIFGIVGFTLTSMLAGLAFNLTSMIIFRILQAVTVSIDYPLALSIIAVNFTDRDERLQAMGLWSAIFAAAVVFGPLLGGPLIDNFSWRAVFYINVPVGIVATLMAMRFIKEPVKEKRGISNFDVWGSLLLGIFLGVLVLVLNQGQSWGWGSGNSVISYLVCVVSFVLFLMVEKKAKEPVVDLRFFKIPSFSASIIASFISFMGLIGGIFLVPIFAQTYLGYSVTKTGYIFIPMAFSIFLATQVGTRLVKFMPSRVVVTVGMLISALGMLLFSGIDIKWSFWDLAGHLCIFAFGLGLGLASLTRGAVADVPIQEVGIASSILALARNISGAFGTAIVATILTDSVNSNLINLERFSTINIHNPAVLQQVYFLIGVKANVLAYSTVFKVSFWVMILGALAALRIKDAKDGDSGEGHSVEF